MKRLKAMKRVLKGAWWKFCHGTLFQDKGLLMLGARAEIQADKGSRLRLGSRVTLEPGTLAAVRHGAELCLGNNVYINRNCTLVARQSIVLEDGVTVGPNCCIYDHDHDHTCRGSFVTKPIVIKKNAWIGAGCILLKGITIGENAVIAAGSVVVKDVPDNAILVQKRISEYK